MNSVDKNTLQELHQVGNEIRNVYDRIYCIAKSILNTEDEGRYLFDYIYGNNRNFEYMLTKIDKK